MCVEKKPPAIKLIVAINDGHCKVDNPIIAWPEVQPPAQRVPNPTKNPPITIKIKPFRLKILSTPKMSNGIRLPKSFTPNAFKSMIVDSAISISFGFDIKKVAINPPIAVPSTKFKFQISFFQLYLKKGIFAGIHAAQICLKEDDIPKVLFPRISKVGTVNPINRPAIDQCHGFFSISIIYFLFISF